jgi:hypothetical protein
MSDMEQVNGIRVLVMKIQCAGLGLSCTVVLIVNERKRTYFKTVREEATVLYGSVQVCIPSRAE